MDARGPNMSCVMTGLQRKQTLQSTLNCYMLWQSTKYKELPCRMCFQCEKTNTIKVKLENHMKFHMRGKIFSCEQCRKAFTHKIVLQQYTRTHTREKSSSCKYSEQSITISSVIRRLETFNSFQKRKAGGGFE